MMPTGAAEDDSAPEDRITDRYHVLGSREDASRMRCFHRAEARQQLATTVPCRGDRHRATWQLTPGRMVTASSPASSASCGRPRSASRFDRLCSDLARSGRNASGRAAETSKIPPGRSSADLCHHDLSYWHRE
jgi:hypothetical protein